MSASPTRLVTIGGFLPIRNGKWFFPPKSER
jgi:hypothetical protein